MRWSCLTTLIVSLLVLSGCAQPETSAPAPTLPTSADQIKRFILVETEAIVVHYQGESFWAEAEFSAILEAKDEFSSDIIAKFEDDVSEHDQQAINANVEFNEDKKSTILSCDIHGAMYSSNSYDFHWLLADLPFDLYQFKQSEKELNYEGEVNGVPTTIRLIFPYTIAHCHEHVWPAK